MSLTVKNYNPKDVTVTINGIYLTGLGEDMISFEFDEERFEATVGAQGDVVVNETNNQLATLTVNIQATSPQYLECLRLARNGTTFPVWVVNKSIGERCGGTMARFKNAPEIAYGTELDDREFEIAIFDGVVEPVN